MTISTWLMILAFAISTWTAQSSESVSPDPTRRGIAGECYINGTWYNPCPDKTFPHPEVEQKNQQP